MPAKNTKNIARAKSNSSNKETTPQHRGEAINFNKRKILDFLIILTALILMFATGYCICRYPQAVAEKVQEIDYYEPIPGAFDGLTEEEIEDKELEKAASQMIDRQAAEPSRGEVRTLQMEATAYCYTGCRTYTGAWPVEGRTIAVDPEVIPLGSKLIINGQGGYVAEDTGGLIKGRRIDIYLNDEQSCWEFGRRDVEVQVLE